MQWQLPVGNCHCLPCPLVQIFTVHTRLPFPPFLMAVQTLEVDEHHLITASLIHQGDAGCLLIFDSHDDLGVPPRLLGSAALSAVKRGDARSVASMDIGTWILPAIYAGKFSTVLWVSAWTTNLPHASFTALVGPHKFSDCGLALSVACAPSVPADWRALWADYCLPIASLSASELKGMVPFRVVHTDAGGAVKVLRRWREAAAAHAGGEGAGTTCPPSRKRRRSSSCAGGGASGGGDSPSTSSPSTSCASPPLPTTFQCTIDLDFFSVRNPALRAIPWTEHPSFRRELIALARQVPMAKGAAFVDTLEKLAAYQDPAAALPALLKCGISPGATPGAKLTLLSLLSTIAVRFAADLHGPSHLRAVLSSLLLVALAEHEATVEELQALEGACASVLMAAWPARGAAAIPPILIARSELYTPRRQLKDIVDLARRAVSKLSGSSSSSSSKKAKRNKK